MTPDAPVEVDLLVFGSGAGGLATAVFAAQRGLRVLLCEKSAQLGGTTATSGGVVWIPCSPQARQAGVADSAEAVRTYLRDEAGALYRDDLVSAYLAHGVPALQALEQAGVPFDLIDMPDYHSAAPGAVARGRSLQARAYDGRELGADFAKVRAPISNLLVLGGMMLGPDDVAKFVRPLASFAAFSRVVSRVLRHAGDRLPSLPHIEMTLETLRGRGVRVSSPEPATWVVEPGPIAGAEVAIEPDLSNAGPFLAAALLAGGTVTITGWPATTTQVGDLFATLLPRFGATVTRSAAGLTVGGGAGYRGGRTWPGVDLDLSAGGELAPTFAALAALATTTSRISGIGHLRGHETDRLAALAADLNALGGRVSELPDGLGFEPAPLRGGAWAAYGDHRMATTGALLGLVVPGVVVDDIGTTAKTLPEFPALWEGLTA